jgi:transmembrane sensor
MQAMLEEALTSRSGLVVPIATQHPGKRWQHLLPLAAAASIVASIFLALMLPDFMSGGSRTASFDTGVDEQRALTLHDGTLANLDVDSALTVTMTDRARDISLVKGRALFDVVPDKQRPFSVTVGASRVIALGTRFQVQVQDQWVTVTLEEGSIDVVGEAEGRLVSERLNPGEQLRFTQGSSAWLKTRVETDAATSWSRGRHVFRNVRLGAALDEVNRYAATPVLLGDPALADLTVSGNFMLGESSKILAAFAAALPVRVVESGAELILFPVYERDVQLAPDSVQ